MNIDSAVLDDVLRNLGLEFAHVGAIGRRIEDAVAPLISQTGIDARPARSALQEIDLLVQISQDLQNFLTNLADAAPKGCTVNLGPATETLKLDRVRANILGVEGYFADDEDAYFG